jgi:hypothetical protein
MTLVAGLKACREEAQTSPPLCLIQFNKVAPAAKADRHQHGQGFEEELHAWPLAQPARGAKLITAMASLG